MKTAYFSSAYLAPIQYFQKLVSTPKSVIEQHDNYIKQTYRNRCYIAGAEGIHNLTIPVVKPKSESCSMRDIEISSHGNWQHLHWNAIQSAYNNTPYFEYYKDAFIPFYEKKERYLFDLNSKLQELVSNLLDLEIDQKLTTKYKENFDSSEVDYRDLIHPKRPFEKFDPEFISKPYHQVFQERHGFIPNMSIIDLLFNKGPEAIFYLDKKLLSK